MEKRIHAAFFMKGVKAMHFTGTKYLHEIETIMQEVPGFSAKGHGGIVLKKEMEDCIRGQPPPDSYEEMMSEIVAAVHYKPLEKRLSQYLKESEGKAVSYRNEKHKVVFEEITAKMDKNNFALLSALYLLTADHRLWKIMKHHDIREAVEREQSIGDMAQYFDEDAHVKEKLVSAVWTVDEVDKKLYGRVNVRLKEPLTEEETKILKEWITGQNNTRKAWKELNLFDLSHCMADENGKDYTNQVVVLNPFVLQDDYKSPDYQLFLATGGFGCSPEARGRKVFGSFLKDGESAQFQRSDFIGVIKEEYLPEWAVEKLQEVSQPEEGTSEGQQMGGM